MPTAELRPSRIGAPGSLNFDTRQVGRAVPAFRQFQLSDTDRLHYFVGAIETKAPSGTSFGAAPRQYAGVNKSMLRLDNGTITDDTSGLSGGNFGDVIVGMGIFNSGGYSGDATSVTATTLTDSMAVWPTNFFGTTLTLRMGGAHATVTSNSDTVLTFTGGWLTPAGVASATPEAGPYTIDASGTPMLLATFGTSATTRLAARNLTTDTSPWTVPLTPFTGYAQLWGLVSLGSAGFASFTDAGIAALGEWRVSICPIDNDPRIATSWGNGLEVGGPQWANTGLAAIGTSPVVGRPDGLWYYDMQTRQYENVMKHLELVPHALNGKVTENVQNGVIYTTHDGKAYFFDGASVTEVSPHKFWPILSRDIGNSRITAVADCGEFIAMYTELAYQTTQNAGIQIIRSKVADTPDSFDVTANGIDGNMTTGVDLSSMAVGDTLDVFADIPMEGLMFSTTRQPNGTAAAVWGTMSYTSANNTFTAAAGLKDGTKLSSGGSMSYVGFPPSASAGAVLPTNLNFGSLMQRVNVAYNGGVLNVTNKYGIRLTLSGASFDAVTETDEIEIIPFRPGMPNGGIYSTTTNFTERDRAGLIGHVYLIKRERTTGFTPHDVYGVDSYPGVWKMAWHTGRLGQPSGAQNLGQSLILWGRYRTYAISEAITRDPVRSRRPLLQLVSTVAPGPLVQIAHEWAGKNDVEWSRRKRLEKIKIDTRLVQPTDEIEVFAEIDGRDIISLGVYKGGPLFIVPVNIPAFRWINIWVGFSQASAAVPNAPYLVEPYELDYDFESGDAAQDPATPTPEAA